MGAWIVRITKQPFVAHLLRAIGRFNTRLGSQFAAAITYFSVLALVPILMFAFATLGMTLTVFYPSLINQAGDLIANQLQSAQGADEVMEVVRNALNNWASIGIVAILAAGYAGAGWVSNLRQAVNAMWRRVFDMTPAGGGPLAIVTTTLKNLGVLIGLMILVGLTLAASSIATTVRDIVLRFLGLTDSPVASGLVVAGSVLVSLITGWLLFVYLYTVLPADRKPFKAVAAGAVFGAIGLALLINGAGLLTRFMFGRNPAIAVFGPVILLFLMLNLFATIVMLGAAWTATAEPEEQERHYALDPGEPDAHLKTPVIDPPPMVPQPIAQRGVKIGMGVGYGIGAATGLGAGALIGRIVGGVRARRRVR